MTEQIAELIGKTPHSVNLPFSNAKLEGAAASLVTDSDRELLAPVMAGLHDDLVVDDNKLQSVFGVTPTPFTEAAREALEEMQAAA